MRVVDEDGVIEGVEVIFPDGHIELPGKVKDKGVKRIIDSELGRAKTIKDKAPAHIKLMKQLEIAEPEPRVSDAGSIRWYPNGAFICELFRRLAYDISATSLHSYLAKTPMIINPKDPAVNKMMSAFPERLYRVLPGLKSKKQEFKLRPACDYGVFSIFKDARVSYKDLPVRLYEYEDADWRYEQRGELLGLKRVRQFQMADIHTMVAAGEPALKEFAYQMKEFGIRWYHEFGIEPSGIVLNCMEDFYEANKESFKEMSTYANLPIVVKLFTKMKTYKVAWFDVMAFDILGRPIEVDTVQLDTESPKWWGITYIDKDGKKKYPNIIHTGIGTERAIMTILEWEAVRKDGLPRLPLWLAPAQVRILSVNERNNAAALKLCKALNRKGVRAELDDRNEKLSKKVREAGIKWINYVITFGDKEEKSSTFKAFVRAENKEKKYTVSSLVKEIKDLCKGKPYLPLPMPVHLSVRPVFRSWDA